jgi:hypothetical protein
MFLEKLLEEKQKQNNGTWPENKLLLLVGLYKLVRLNRIIIHS